MLHGLDLSLAPGRATVLLGENGSGKSTLLKVLAGLIAPVRGSVRLEGRELPGIERKERARLVGYLPQGYEPFFAITALELVLLGRTPHLSGFGRVSARDLEVARRSLAAMDAASFAAEDILAMSGGERQRVLLARVLCGEPRILLLDEPTSNLDPRHRILVAQALRRHVASGGTAVLSTHEMDLVALVADDVVLLKEGRLLGCGTRDEMLTEGRLSELFGIPAHVARGPEGEPFVFLGGSTSPT